jgi:hypothetical protein
MYKFVSASILVGGIAALQLKDAAILQAENAGSDTSIINGAAAAGSSAAADLSGVIADVARRSGGSIEGAPSIPSGSVSQAESSIRRKFEEAQITHMKAANPYETAEETAVEEALRSAIKQPSRVGSVGSMGSAAGVPSSWLATQSSSMLTPTELSAISTQVADAVAHETRYTRFASGCPACSNGANYDGCPMGWSMDRAGICTAPATYTGYCNAFGVSGLSKVRLQEAEYLCGVCYPCSGA